MTERLATTARILLSTALLAAAAYMATQTTRLLLDGPEPPTAPLAAPAASAPPARTTPTALAVTQDNVQIWQLFGAYQATPALQTAQTAPESTLDMTLLGVFRGGSDTTGWAIIRTDDEAMLYRPGDTLSSDITLHALHPDYVLLERAGGLEKLSLLAWDAIPGIAMATETLAKKTDGKTEALRLGSRGKAMKQLGVEPVAPGTASGYRIVDDKGDLVKKMGFKKGDVFVSVNGYPLGTQDADTLARQSVVDAGVGNIVVLRNGKQFLLEYQMSKGNVRGMAALVAQSREDHH